jgi:hypothetical protein
VGGSCGKDGRNLYVVFVVNPKEKRPLARLRRRWECGIKWTLGRLAGGGVEWIHLAQDRDCWRALVRAVMNLRVLAPRI